MLTLFHLKSLLTGNDVLYKTLSKNVQMDRKAAHVELSVQDLRLMYVARMIWSAHMAKSK